MFKKNDPLVESVKRIMEENELRRRVEARLCEELGIASRKALPFEHHANYDALLEQLIAEEGSHPRNEKEARLAAMKHPKNKITHADVLKGRGVIDETDMSDTSMKQAAKPTTPDSGKSSDTSTGQAAKPTTSSSAPSTPSSSSGRGSPRPVHLAPNASPNYGMIQQEEDTHEIEFADKPGQKFKALGKDKDDLSSFNAIQKSQSRSSENSNNSSDDDRSTKYMTSIYPEKPDGTSSGPGKGGLPGYKSNRSYMSQKQFDKEVNEEDRSSSDPDMAAPADPRAPKYKDEIKYKDDSKSTMPKNPPMPPRRPANLEEKASPEQQDKIARVMREFRNRKLHSGSKKGPTVTDRKQAIAIALNQAGLSKKDGKDD